MLVACESCDLLPRSNSVFWNASGLSADLGLTGLHVHAESLHALLAGGLAFATPDPPGRLVEPGSIFKLHREVKDKWLGWSPVLWRGPARKTPDTASAGAKEAEAPDKASKPGLIARFFHHEGKSKQEAADEVPAKKDAAHEAAHHERKHGFLSSRHR